MNGDGLAFRSNVPARQLQTCYDGMEKEGPGKEPCVSGADLWQTATMALSVLLSSAKAVQAPHAAASLHRDSLRVSKWCCFFCADFCAAVACHSSTILDISLPCNTITLLGQDADDYDCLEYNRKTPRGNDRNMIQKWQEASKAMQSGLDKGMLTCGH